MKKKSTTQSAFFYLRVSVGLLLVLAGVFLAMLGLGQFSAQAQQKNEDMSSRYPLVPAMVDCDQMRAHGLDRQENLRAGAIAIFCGDAKGGAPAPSDDDSLPIVQEMLAPLFGTVDQDLVTGTETSPHITQSETFTAANPDNPNEILVAFNDSRGVSANPISVSGASVSNDGGNTFTRLTASNGQGPFPNTYGDPVLLYNRIIATWYTVWLDGSCGGQGLGGFKSTTPSDPSSSSWIHFCVHTGSDDDRPSGWIDNNPSSPYYGRMYVSFNDFNRGDGALFVRYSTDNGATWSNERQLSSSFIRDVQITGDLATGTVYVAAMDEMGGGLGNRANHIYRSTDGGNSWTNSYTGPTFAGPGRSASGYFATMYANPPYWRHQGWGEPAALNGIVHYVYAARNTSTGDPGDIYYIRSTDGGTTFSAPVKLNTDTDPSKAQWQPNLSIAEDGSLLSVWYDERENTGSCQPSSPSNPCYRMWARKSTDNGVTWLPDAPFSDVLSPLPLQPDGSIVSIYAGDYDYGSSLLTQHIHAWVDGRNAINGASQQDAYVDRDPATLGGANLVSAASQLKHGSAGTFNIPMPLTGTSGVEDRDTGGRFLAVFTFDKAVTSGSAAIITGTATVGTPTFSGKQMRVPLTGVTNAQVVTIQVSNVNGGSGSNNVSFGFLIADTDSSRTVTKTDLTDVNGQIGQPVTAANFREDIIPDGTIKNNDAREVKTHKGQSIP